jgi:hypothetical protein
VFVLSFLGRGLALADSTLKESYQHNINKISKTGKRDALECNGSHITLPTATANYSRFFKRRNYLLPRK